jgi:hypothetical protein
MPVLQIELVTGYNFMRKRITIRIVCIYERDIIGYSNFIVELFVL